MLCRNENNPLTIFLNRKVGFTTVARWTVSWRVIGKSKLPIHICQIDSNKGSCDFQLGAERRKIRQIEIIAAGFVSHVVAFKAQQDDVFYMLTNPAKYEIGLLLEFRGKRLHKDAPNSWFQNDQLNQFPPCWQQVRPIWGSLIGYCYHIVLVNCGLTRW